jgi:predicted protein tyrosine phosphatase
MTSEAMAYAMGMAMGAHTYDKEELAAQLRAAAPECYED